MNQIKPLLPQSEKIANLNRRLREICRTFPTFDYNQYYQVVKDDYLSKDMFPNESVTYTIKLMEEPKYVSQSAPDIHKIPLENGRIILSGQGVSFMNVLGSIITLRNLKKFSQLSMEEEAE